MASSRIVRALLALMADDRGKTSGGGDRNNGPTGGVDPRPNKPRIIPKGNVNSPVRGSPSKPGWPLKIDTTFAPYAASNWPWEPITEKVYEPEVNHWPFTPITKKGQGFGPEVMPVDPHVRQQTDEEEMQDIFGQMNKRSIFS